MKTIFTFIMIATFFHAVGQSSQIKQIETEIKNKVNGGTFEKKIVDLNNDGKQDIIYLYSCGEPNCIKVFLKTAAGYKEQITEQCSSYSLKNEGQKKLLFLTLSHCCGESPYVSNRAYTFNASSAVLKENYVLTNADYTEETRNLIPYAYSSYTYNIRVSIDKYNLRFSPDIEKLAGKVKETFTYACEEETNIIATLQINARLKVLSKLVLKDRTWLFVEVNSDAISGTCNPIDFGFKNQKLRGWISDKYVVNL